jgi:hypothetical protein
LWCGCDEDGRAGSLQEQEQSGKKVTERGFPLRGQEGVNSSAAMFRRRRDRLDHHDGRQEQQGGRGEQPPRVLRSHRDALAVLDAAGIDRVLRLEQRNERDQSDPGEAPLE